MSYDLAVFEPLVELQVRSTFMQWYKSRTKWTDSLDYCNASNATPALQGWYQDMIGVFPPLGGPTERGGKTEYVIGTDIIYVAFRWDKPAVAYETTRRMAEKHAVGFFDASGGRGEVWFPSTNGGLELIHEGPVEYEHQGSFARHVADAKKRTEVVHCESMEDLVTQMLEMDPANPKVIIVDPTPPINNGRQRKS
jgi:hypothetical protein